MMPMYQRCNNPAGQSYSKYGGRGLKLEISRAEFIEHFIQKTENLTVSQIRKLQIDRIDNNIGYVKGNMRLISQKKNLTNTRRNSYYEYKEKAIVPAHMWHFIKRDYPDFSLSLRRTAVLTKEGKSIEYILQVPSKPKRTLASQARIVDEAVIALYDEEYEFIQ